MAIHFRVCGSNQFGRIFFLLFLNYPVQTHPYNMALVAKYCLRNDYTASQKLIVSVVRHENQMNSAIGLELF
jgi:hypothetical protein